MSRDVFSALRPATERASPKEKRADAAASNRSGADSGMSTDAPPGFETGVSFTNLPEDPSVRFDIQRQEIHDDVLRATYRMASYGQDQRARFNLYTREGEYVTQLRVQYGPTSIPAGDDYPVRIYFVRDTSNLTPAARETRERLNLERFAKALATLPSLRTRQTSYRIFFEPLEPGGYL